MGVNNQVDDSVKAESTGEGDVANGASAPKQSVANQDQVQTASTPLEQEGVLGELAVPADRPKPAGILEETAKAFGGNVQEAKSLDVVDGAETSAEAHVAKNRRTSSSPAFQAVWGKKFPFDEFAPRANNALSPAARECVATMTLLRDSNRLYGPDGKFSEYAIAELGRAGYWGMLVPREYGGKGASMFEFTRLITEAAKVDPSAAGLCSIHGCIGAVDPLTAFGNNDQKKRYLPLLASGERLSAFALTEPGAGSDLTAVKTEAKLVGDKFLVNGEKLFISNVAPGRTVGLVCLINGKPATLLVDIPMSESEQFRFNDYPLYALRRVGNRGMVFNNFEVPKENLLDPTKGGTMKGDGLTIAYHGLNRGRIALCANAGGAMAGLLADVLPFAEQRVTYAKLIAERQLVQARLGHAAAQIVGCEAISTWCANLLDEGYRGELECIVAKVFGSEAQKTVALDDIMKTHGGRSFLGGHSVGDNLHDLLAPLIYEGEGDMLSMGFLKSLIKDHAERFFAPIAIKVSALKKEGKLRENFDPGNGSIGELLKIRREAAPYAMWLMKQKVGQVTDRLFGGAAAVPKGTPQELAKHLSFASKALPGMVSKIDAQMRKYGPKLQDEQSLLVGLSRDTQNLIMIAVTASWGSAQSDQVLVKAAGLLCEELSKRVTGGKLSHRYHKGLASLGRDVLARNFGPTKGLKEGAVMMPYAELKG